MSAIGAREAAVKAAMSVAQDVSAGRLSPADLDQTLAAECRALVGNVVGPSDPLWSAQVDIARGVLAAGGLPPGELAEWLAVARRLADADPAPPTPPRRTPGELRAGLISCPPVTNLPR